MGRKAISPIWYYSLVSVFTSLVFIFPGLIVFSSIPFFSINIFTGSIIIIFLLIEGVIAVILSMSIHIKSRDTELATKFIGRHIGRVYGCLIGGFLGAAIAEILGWAFFPGLAAGVLVFFFVGRWAGGKISRSIGRQINKLVTIADTQVQGG